MLAQMWKAAGYRVVSEAGAVNAALRSNPAWLPRLTAEMGAEFVKFDAWHIHELLAIRRVFPRTPWVFVGRDPAEVVASHHRSPGMQALPGAMDPSLLRMTMADVTGLEREAWTERVIGKMRESAEEHRGDPMGLFVDYCDLPDAAWGAVARHFGIELTAGQVARMREVARYDAKSPGMLFARAPKTAGLKPRAD